MSALVVILDQWSKHWVMQHLQLDESLRLTSFLNLTLTFNQGAAFSFLHHIQDINTGFIVFSSLMIIVMMLMLWRTPPQQKIVILSWGLVMGGAFANLLDRIQFHAVVDFIHLYWKDYHFAIFNLADSAICLGAILLAFCYKELSA